ncbi:MAG: GntR family transcriptional regulator [Alphaproteobacteria bacterium]|nr:GntR family transcriptional regulator [Alphaproteobacteria bacterium]MBM3951587.1 GntR family transcriptional regulator [Rhodospirillales bacterium]
MTHPRSESTAAAAVADSRSLTEKAYQLLVQKLTRLELVPGAPLIEKNLSADLGIGRTPIREALQRLAAEGLVTHHINRGMFVAEISPANIQQIYEFRQVVDGYAARLSAVRANEKDIEDLRKIQLSLVQATEDDDIDAYVIHARQFHETLARVARNAYLAETMLKIFNLHLRLWFLISQRVGTWHEIARAHEEMTKGIVEGVARRDPDQAESAVTTYVSRRHQDLRELL